MPKFYPVITNKSALGPSRNVAWRKPKVPELHMSCSEASADLAHVPNVVGTQTAAYAPGWDPESEQKMQLPIILPMDSSSYRP